MFFFTFAMLGGKPANKNIDKSVIAAVMINRVFVFMVLERTLLLFPFARLQRRYGVPGHFNLYVLGYSDLNPIVFESNNRSVDPAGGNDLVAGLQVVDHLLQLFLFIAGRQEDDQIKNDENERQY